MKYKLSEDLFKQTYVDSNDKIRHKTGSRIKLFPYITNKAAEPITDLETITGRIISLIEGVQIPKIILDDIIAELEKSTKVPVGYEEVFKRLITTIYFTPDGNIRPLNLKLLEASRDVDSTEKKLAEYIASTLGEKQILKEAIKQAHYNSNKNSNVLENMIISSISKDVTDIEGDVYFRITESLKDKFNSDFEFLMGNEKLIKEHLVQLLEFYYFSYTAQAVMNLERYFEGNRNETIPLFFSLDWEKTSLSRRCYIEGWMKLQEAINKVFAHVVVLDFLNLTPEGFPLVDYIELRNIVDGDIEVAEEMAKEVSKITDLYREYIQDCSQMKDLERDPEKIGDFEAEVRFLFKSVKTQFEYARSGPYKAYAKKFSAYCDKFLKSRGRSGMMLTLTEEMLLFLTKISIKNHDRLRLKDVFEEFRLRGVYLDDASKDEITAYYEKLNLIEKKSDSGDAKYVKRIL